MKLWRFLPVCLALSISNLWQSPAEANSCDAWKKRYETVREQAQNYKTRYEWALAKSKNCSAGAGEGQGKAGSLKSAMKNSDGKLGLALCEDPKLACSSTMKLFPPNPPSDDEAYLWLESLLVIQRVSVESLVGASEFSKLEAAEANLCAGGRLYCKAAYRQEVIRALLD